MLLQGLGHGKSACRCKEVISVVDPSSIVAGFSRQLTALEGVVKNKLIMQTAHRALAHTVIYDLC